MTQDGGDKACLRIIAQPEALSTDYWDEGGVAMVYFASLNNNTLTSEYASVSGTPLGFSIDLDALPGAIGFRNICVENNVIYAPGANSAIDVRPEIDTIADIMENRALSTVALPVVDYFTAGIGVLVFPELVTIIAPNTLLVLLM